MAARGPVRIVMMMEMMMMLIIIIVIVISSSTAECVVGRLHKIRNTMH